MADGLTVEGIPGDLTSHGWMQGARSPSSSFQLPAGSTLFSQLCVLGGDIIAPTRNFFFFLKCPDGQRAAGFVSAQKASSSSTRSGGSAALCGARSTTRGDRAGNNARGGGGGASPALFTLRPPERRTSRYGCKTVWDQLGTLVFPLAAF